MTKKPLPIELPIEIKYQDLEELNKILLILDCYSVMWISGTSPANFIPTDYKQGKILITKEKKIGYANLSHKSNYQEIPLTIVFGW